MELRQDLRPLDDAGGHREIPASGNPFHRTLREISPLRRTLCNCPARWYSRLARPRYVREWILRHARILASIDLHPDTFQPLVSIQTSVLVLERKDQQLVAIEQAAGKLNDYCVFMAVANHIGHDKRGNKTYVRNKDGSELVRELVRSVLEYENGIPVYKSQRVQMKEVDDNTQQIAHQFRQWLSEQD